MSGGDGSNVANWQVNSYIGLARWSRLAWYSASASPSGRRPDQPSSSAVVSASASMNASLIPCAVIGSLS